MDLAVMLMITHFPYFLFCIFGLVVLAKLEKRLKEVNKELK